MAVSRSPCAARPAVGDGGRAARSNNVTAWPRASKVSAILSPTNPAPPKTRILMAQFTLVAANVSQQPRPEILFRIHIRHQPAGRLRRLAARARQEAA